MLFFSKSSIETFIFNIPICTWTSLDLDGWDNIIPFLLKLLIKTSVLGIASFKLNLLELETLGLSDWLWTTLISLIFLFNLFLSKLASLALEETEFNSFIISLASSLASSKIFLALIFALFIIVSSWSFKLSLSCFKELSKSEIFFNFTSISAFSCSIILFWSYIFFKSSSIFICSSVIIDLARSII